MPVNQRQGGRNDAMVTIRFRPLTREAQPRIPTYPDYRGRGVGPKRGNGKGVPLSRDAAEKESASRAETPGNPESDAA